MSMDLDIGPLSWVKSEIDLALERASAALADHAANPGGDALKTAVKLLHQAHGALTIVGLDGITEFSDALEGLFAGLESGKVAWSDEKAQTAQNGLSAVRSYLDGLMAGEVNQPMRLMPAYVALITAAGGPAPSLGALFFPDLSQRPPRREVEPPVLPPDKLEARLKMARMAFERGLLKWLKGSAEDAQRGIGEMKNAIAMIEATQIQPAERAFWWIALGVYDALAKHAFAGAPLQMEARKLAMKIGGLIKHFTEGKRDVPERLVADALYLVALAPAESEQASIVKAAYRLDGLIPRSANTDIETLRPQIRRLREILAGGKDDWNRLCAGSAAALPPFHEKVTQLGEKAPVLANDGVTRLCAALSALIDALRRDPSRHNDTMGLEVATALLLIDSALENFENLDPEFAGHADTMAGRLDALSEQRDLESIDLPHLDAMARRAQERLLLATVAREIAANLNTIEQTLDAYFRDASKLATLADLSRPIKQIEGALMILGQDRAVAVLGECEASMVALANGELCADKAVFESLASKLSGLGFFVEQLEVGSTPDIDVILGSKVAAPEPLPPVVEASAARVVAPPAEAAEAPAEEVAIASPEPENEPPGVDAELLEIFLEEAGEVLATISEQLPIIHRSPNDQAALTTLRRSFHTLKGSGRMVSLNELGEAAWAVEQVMNHWLDEHRGADGALLAMLDQAHTLFAAWVEQLAHGGSAHRDASALESCCRHLLTGPAPADTASEAIAAVAPPALTEVDDTRSAADLVADMEASAEADAAARAESELAAAELAAAEIAAEVAAGAVDVTGPASVEEALSWPDTPQESAVPPQLTFAGTETIAPASVSDEELLAAELAAAEILSAASDARTEGAAAPVPEEPAQDVSVLAPASEPASAEIHAFPAPPALHIGTLEISPTLYAIYIEEALGHLAAIHEEIGHTGTPSDRLIRSAHTLASTSGTTGIESIHHLARALEIGLGGLAIVNAAPSEGQRLLLARCAGALEGMLGAVQAKRLPAAEEALTAELYALKPEPLPGALTHPGELPPVITEFALPAKAPAAPTADEPEPAAESRLAQRLEDEIDEQLLPLFLEEAVDLMASIDAQLRGWRGQPESDGFPRQLQRDLHTLKGSARMAGAMGCGDVFHSMESRIEQGMALRSITPELFDSLETSYDRGALLIDRLHRGEFTAPGSDEAVPEAIVGIDRSDRSAPVPEPGDANEPASATTAAPSAPVTSTHLRVRADLIDSLVNEAGEVAIARARIEGEMRSLKASLLELTENVIRLRQQVREIEIQAETQMASQLTELKAQAEQEGRVFDPLEFDRFTRFQELTRMMAESVNDVSTVQHTLLGNVTSADAALSAQARLSRELSQRLMGVRMMPFESLAERLHRVVRQAAKDSGKRANLDIKGGQMGIDRSILEHIGAPLEHLLRNAVAHGLESGDAREQAGKDTLGQITLSLAQEGNDVVISLADDGAGLNLERIRARAVERGLLAADAPCSDARLIGMIFESGFSTADSVSALSGRGVGMDVVKTEIEGLGGHIEIATVAGQGSTFRLYLPLTLAVSQAVIIKVGSRSYALPASMVEQASELKPEVIARIREEGGSEWLGRKYPYRYLPALLGMGDAGPAPARRHWLLLIKGGTERLALEVDGMVGNREIVIKNLGAQLHRIPGLAGATVLSDGEIALILNPIALLARDATRTGAAPVLASARETPAAITNEPTVMVVDDSLTVRKVSGRLLGRHGYQVVTAKDGVDALEQLNELHPDVMLVDIEMPRMDGFELARNVRADTRLRDIPIIMITSRSADKHRRYAQEIGVNHYLGKPYDETQLLELIAGYIQGKKHA